MTVVGSLSESDSEEDEDDISDEDEEDDRFRRLRFLVRLRWLGRFAVAVAGAIAVQSCVCCVIEDFVSRRRSSWKIDVMHVSTSGDDLTSADSEAETESQFR